MRSASMLLALASGLLFACGGGHTDANSNSAAMQPSSGSSGGGTPAAGLCETDTRGKNFAVGLKQAGMQGKYSVQIMNVDPGHPTKGENTWHIAVTDAAGAPADGLTIKTRPYMPDHNHGSSIIPTSTGMGGGVYEIKNLVLFMPGIWQFTFTMSSGATNDTAVFLACVDS
jgi:hypothetical protein